jgi:hypothetical protein
MVFSDEDPFGVPTKVEITQPDPLCALHELLGELSADGKHEQARALALQEAARRVEDYEHDKRRRRHAEKTAKAKRFWEPKKTALMHRPFAGLAKVR